MSIETMKMAFADKLRRWADRLDPGAARLGLGRFDCAAIVRRAVADGGLKEAAGTDPEAYLIYEPSRPADDAAGRFLGREIANALAQQAEGQGK